MAEVFGVYKQFAIQEHKPNTTPIKTLMNRHDTI
jgi:hypothetical protein